MFITRLQESSESSETELRMNVEGKGSVNCAYHLSTASQHIAGSNLLGVCHFVSDAFFPLFAVLTRAFV